MIKKQGPRNFSHRSTIDSDIKSLDDLANDYNNSSLDRISIKEKWMKCCGIIASKIRHKSGKPHK